MSLVCVGLPGVSSGGSSGAGGSLNSPSTGGAAVTNGGTSNTQTSSGSAGTGGTPNTGGTSSTGGTSNTGGTPSTGGTPNTGGAPSTGGKSNTGGTSSTGGKSNTGGTSSAGGTSSTGGTSSAGGTSSTGGTPSTGGTLAQAGAPASIGFIDDFEQGTLGALPIREGRAGCWYTFKDAATTQTPVPLPTGSACSFPYATPGYDSSHAVRTYGTTSASGWAGIGFDLVCPSNDATQKQPYDAAARGFTGFTFWARAGNAAAAAYPIRVTVPDRYTDPAGGYCSTACNDNWYKPITLTTTWEKYAFRWSDAALTRRGTGSPLHALDTTGLMSIHFQFVANASFDLWIDDIRFIQ